MANELGWELSTERLILEGVITPPGCLENCYDLEAIHESNHEKARRLW